MEERKQFQFAIVAMILLLVWSFVIIPSLGCSSSNRNGCKDCIRDQMKYGCPACTPILRCMATCLWGGKVQSKCVKQCDCNGGKPRLSDCKKCMARCKCSCATT
ncbi:hypothetical protein BVC80_8975g7 [Macleaya cordata]|uniref:Uncharacterized protein n=1 Tax=Macleaya cordata TaxID=56857 RepID=A0A200R0S3_MACCD|nr:hypothetical protein BVC80_8975g7 [Macleaya cordata]